MKSAAGVTPPSRRPSAAARHYGPLLHEGIGHGGSVAAPDASYALAAACLSFVAARRCLLFLHSCDLPLSAFSFRSWICLRSVVSFSHCFRHYSVSLAWSCRCRLAFLFSFFF